MEPTFREAKKLSLLANRFKREYRACSDSAFSGGNASGREKAKVRSRLRAIVTLSKAVQVECAFLNRRQFCRRQDGFLLCPSIALVLKSEQIHA